MRGKNHVPVRTSDDCSTRAFAIHRSVLSAASAGATAAGPTSAAASVSNFTVERKEKKMPYKKDTVPRLCLCMRAAHIVTRNCLDEGAIGARRVNAASRDGRGVPGDVGRHTMIWNDAAVASGWGTRLSVERMTRSRATPAAPQRSDALP